MRQISSEPKFEAFSPLPKTKSSFSNSESNLQEKDKYSLLENSGTSLSSNSSFEEEQKLSPIQESVEFREGGDAPTTIAPPDGGWGWVVCFACFMGNITILFR